MPAWFQKKEKQQWQQMVATHIALGKYNETE